MLRRRYVTLVAAVGAVLLSASPVGPVRQAAAVAYQPLQSVGSAPGIPVGSGPVPSGTFMSFSISDRVLLRVNVGSGNVLLTTADIAVPEIGTSFVLGTSYNSLLVSSGVAVGSNGYGWRQREGIDVQLYPASDGSVTYLGEDGTAGKFTPSGSGYTSPSQFHATLVKSSGTTCGGAGYTMRWHATGEVMCFTTAGLLTSEADRNGNTTAFGYNGSNQETQITYTPHGASGAVRTVSVSYTGSYLTGLSQSGGSAGTRTVTYAVNSATGNLSSVTQPDGTKITFGYDSSHDLTSIANGDNVTTNLAYNSSHQVTSVSQTTTGTTATTRFAYPSSTQTLEADPNTSQSQSVSSVPHVTYTVGSTDALITKVVDQQGNTRSRSYTPFDDVATYTNGVGGTTTNTYGANTGESLTKSQSSTGAAISLAYGSATSTNPEANFQPSSSTDAQGHATAYTYDGAGNLLQAANALPAIAKVTYNSDGTPASSTDPANGSNSTTYSYTDGDHEVNKVTPPTGNSLQPRTLTYDGFGRLATETDGAGNTATSTYDLADRITKVAYTGGAHPVTVSYSYDGAGNLVTRTDPSGTTTWTYDGRNLVLSRTATSGGGTLSYGYDLDGNLTSVTDPHARQLAGDATTTYSYDDRNLLTEMVDPSGNQWRFAYDADGRRTTTWFDTNASESTWAGKQVTTYDKSGRIASIEADGSQSGTVFAASYCYSPHVSGQSCPTGSSSTDTSLVQWVSNTENDINPGTTTVYSYDKANRLTQATNNGYGSTSTYAYDADGNMTSANDLGTTSTWTYNSANEITGSGYAYDGAGNQTSDPFNGTMAYNDAGQMTSTTSWCDNCPAPQTENFSYGDRTQAEVLSDGSATGITYGLAGQDKQPWIQDYEASDGSRGIFVLHDQQGDILGEEGNDPAAPDTMYVTDNVGSVVATIDPSGNGFMSGPYTPYGLDDAAGDLDPLFTYTGAMQDVVGATTPGTSLIHLGNRWYDPASEPDIGVMPNQTGPAHFTQQDSQAQLVSPSDGNLYGYAGDSPATYIDPTGQSFWSSLLNFGQQVLGVASACYGGAVGAEGAAAPAQGLIALLPGADVITEAAIPLAGCAIGATTSTYLGVNILSP